MNKSYYSTSTNLESDQRSMWEVDGEQGEAGEEVIHRQYQRHQ